MNSASTANVEAITNKPAGNEKGEKASVPAGALSEEEKRHYFALGYHLGGGNPEKLEEYFRLVNK